MANAKKYDLVMQLHLNAFDGIAFGSEIWIYEGNEKAKEYAQKIESQIEGARVKVIDLVSAVGIHTGLGCLALQVFNEMKD